MRIASVLAFSLALAPITARADDQPLVPPSAQPLAQPAAPAVDQPAAADSSRARFSGGRYVVESLVGAAAGSLAFYGVYRGLCSGNAGDDCLGPALAAAAANLAVTPVAQWGVGTAMGGHGSLAWTYYGEALTFAAAPAGSEGLVVASFLSPFMSALTYELSSNKWFAEHGGRVQIMPVTGRNGATAGVALSF